MTFFQFLLDLIDNISSVLTFGALKNARELKTLRSQRLVQPVTPDEAKVSR